MRPLIKAGFCFNLVTGLIFYFFSPAFAWAYLIGSMAMLINLIALAQTKYMAALSFLGLIALTFWAACMSDLNLFVYALGLSSPAYSGLLTAVRFLPSRLA